MWVFKVFDLGSVAGAWHQIRTSDIRHLAQKDNSPRTRTRSSGGDAQPGNRARTPAGKLRKEGDFHAQQHSRGGGGAGACALGAVVHNFGVTVGRWSLIGVRAVGVCLYTEARILHFALITALAARARSERRGGVRGKSQNIQIKKEDRQGNDAERSQCQILICPKRPIASVHKPKQAQMKH